MCNRIPLEGYTFSRLTNDLLKLVVMADLFFSHKVNYFVVSLVYILTTIGGNNNTSFCVVTEAVTY